jgi:hypothetical protein
LADLFVDREEAQHPTSPADLKHWIIYFDGSKNLEWLEQASSSYRQKETP